MILGAQHKLSNFQIPWGLRCIVKLITNMPYKAPLQAVTVKSNYFSVIQMYHDKQVSELRNKRGVVTQNILEAH